MAVVLMGGRKDDQGKLRWDLLPWDAVEKVVCVLTQGASHYGDRNWEKGIERHRLFAATMRHLVAAFHKNQRVSDDNLLHLAQAATNILMWIALDERYRKNERYRDDDGDKDA